MSTSTSSHQSSSRSDSERLGPPDRLGPPHRYGFLSEEVYEPIRWKLPDDSAEPVPAAIKALLARIDIEAAPGCTLKLLPSEFPCYPIPALPASDTESRAYSVPDSSGHQSFDSNFLRDCARSDSAPSAESRASSTSPGHQSIDSTTLRNRADLGGEQAARSGDEFESEAEENAPNDGNVFIENVPIGVQEEEIEQASAATGSQNSSDSGDRSSVDFDDNSTLPPFEQFLKLISDKLVKWNQEDRAAVSRIWKLSEEGNPPSTRIEFDQLKLTKQLVDLRYRFEIFRHQDLCLHRGDWFDTKGFPFTRFEQIFVVPRTRYRAPCEYCGETSVWYDFKQDQSSFTDHKFVHAFAPPPNPFLQPQPLRVECRRGRTAEWLEVHANCINTF